jgi:hypothetical protein
MPGRPLDVPAVTDVDLADLGLREPDLGTLLASRGVQGPTGSSFAGFFTGAALAAVDLRALLLSPRDAPAARPAPAAVPAA